MANTKSIPAYWSLIQKAEEAGKQSLSKLLNTLETQSQHPTKTPLLTRDEHYQLIALLTGNYPPSIGTARTKVPANTLVFLTLNPTEKDRIHQQIQQLIDQHWYPQKKAIFQLVQQEHPFIIPLMAHQTSKGATLKQINAILKQYPLLVLATDRDENTLLHQANSSFYSKLVPLLIHAGAPIMAKNNREETPLHLAAAYGRERAVTQLMKAGADSNANDKWGDTPLYRAVKARFFTIIALLVKDTDTAIQSLDLYFKNKLLLEASKQGDLAFIIKLVQAGADITYSDAGETALDIATQQQHPLIVRYFQRLTKASQKETPKSRSTKRARHA